MVSTKRATKMHHFIGVLVYFLLSSFNRWPIINETGFLILADTFPQNWTATTIQFLSRPLQPNHISHVSKTYGNDALVE